MKGKINISDKYRKKVDELPDNQSELSLYKPLHQEELDEIWEEISTEIVIDEVWNNISSDLDIVMPVDSGSGIIVKSISTVIIILIGMIPLKKATMDSVNSQPDILNMNEQVVQSGKLIRDKIRDAAKGEQEKRNISQELKAYLDKNEGDIKVTPAERTTSCLTYENPVNLSILDVPRILAIYETAGSELAISLGKNPIEESVIPPTPFPSDLKGIKVNTGQDIFSLRWKDNSSSAGSSLPLTGRGKISLGVVMLLKNTWLLNHETLDGLNPQSLTTSKIVFHPDVGLSLNYSLNRTWLLQADAYLYSNTGQKYFKYIYGHYSKKIITLRYSTIALSVKHKFNAGMPRSSINLIGGGYLSVLNNATLAINNKVQKIESQYEKLDLGVRLGSEFELNLTDNLSLAPGLLISFGIPNIYRGEGNIPGYLGRTRNGSAEFHFTFYYHFD